MIFSEKKFVIDFTELFAAHTLVNEIHLYHSLKFANMFTAYRLDRFTRAPKQFVVLGK